MAETDLTVLIKAVLDAKGFEDLQKRLQETKDKASEASSSTSEFSATLSDFGGKLLAATGLAIGMAEAVAFLKDSFREAVESSRAVDQMTAANEMLAGATRASRLENEAWVDSMEKASGRQETEFIPAYLRFLEATNDVTKAQQLTQVAVGASVAGMGELGQITQALTKYWLTGEVGARGFGLAIKALNDQGIVGDQVFQVLGQRYGQAGANIHTAAVEVDRAKASWQNTKEAIGGLALTIADKLGPALHGAAVAIGGVISFINYLLVPVKVLGTALGQIGAALYHLVTGQFKLAADDMKDLWEKTKKIGADALQFNTDVLAKIDAVWDKHTENLKAGADKITGSHKEQGKELEELRKKYQILADTAVQVGMEEVQARIAVLRVYQQMANDPAVARFPDLQAEANKRLVVAINAVGQAVAKEAQDEVAAQKKREKLIQDDINAWLAGETKKVAASRKAADDEFKLQQAMYKALERGDIDYLTQYQGFLQRALVAYQGTADEKVRIERELAQTTIRLEQTKEAAYLATAQAAISFATTTFGQNKAVMIAEGIVNAYAAYARAQKDYGWPYSLIIGALAFATTMAQVAAMESVEPGTSTSGAKTSGFDNPQNDFAAVVGGRKWARDMVDNFSAGAAMGFSQGMAAVGGPTTNDNRRSYSTSTTTHVHVTGALIDSANDVLWRQVAKKVRYAERLDDRRTAR